MILYSKSLKLYFLISLFALFTAFVIACSTEEPDATVTSQQDDSKMEGTVEIDGSSTVYPISEAVAEEFNKLYPKVRIVRLFCSKA